MASYQKVRIKMNLYEISAQYASFLAAVESGEIPDEAIEDTLAGLDGDLEDKIDNIACIVKQLSAEADAIKTERDRLSERQQVKVHKAERLKDYIRQAMALAKKKKIETSRNCVSLGKPTQRAVITSLDALRSAESVWKPYDYGKETNVDKAKLKELLQAGPIPGAVMQDGAPRLTIK